MTQSEQDQIFFHELYDASYERMEYEERPYKVICGCGAYQQASERDLRLAGWQLGTIETCPRCVGLRRAA